MFFKIPLCVATVQGQTCSHEFLADERKFTEPWEGLTCLYSRAGRSTHTASLTSHSRKPQVPYITQRDSVLVGPLKVIGIQCVGPILKVVGKVLLLVAQTSG